MPTKAIINITQFSQTESTGSVNDVDPFAIGSTDNQDIKAAIDSENLVRYVNPAINPAPAFGRKGNWVTEDEESWSDSPTLQPDLLYRFRFGWGRSISELFPIGNFPVLDPGDDGDRLGTLDQYGGIVVRELILLVSSSASTTEIEPSNYGSVSDRVYSESFSFSAVRELPEVTGEATVSDFPFLTFALPEPFSTKNSRTSDVFIRLSNYILPLASGSINLFLNGTQQPDITVTPFVGGFGGFDVNWENQFNFEYDAAVNVRWEFSDTAIPANNFVYQYPFFTVSDTIGPRVSDLFPDDEETGVAINSVIQFKVEDFETDVDNNSLALYVNNTLVVDGVTGDLNFTRLLNQKGYIVQYTPYDSWLYGDLIAVAIFISDTAKNTNRTFFTYSFTTRESLPPRLINIKPSPCTISVPVGVDISVDVIDGGHGIGKDSIIFTVEEIERSGQIALIPIVHRDD